MHTSHDGLAAWSLLFPLLLLLRPSSIEARANTGGCALSSVMRKRAAADVEGDGGSRSMRSQRRPTPRRDAWCFHTANVCTTNCLKAEELLLPCPLPDCVILRCRGRLRLRLPSCASCRGRTGAAQARELDEEGEDDRDECVGAGLWKSAQPSGGGSGDGGSGALLPDATETASSMRSVAAAPVGEGTCWGR